MKNELVKFASLMNTLGLVFGETISQERIAIYYENLCDFPIAEIEMGIKRTIKERQYNKLPTIAEIIGKIAGTTEEHAIRAWSELSQKFTVTSTMPEFDHSEISIIITDYMGGWDKVYYFDQPTFWEEQKLRETFIQAYKVYVENYRRNLTRAMIHGRKAKAELSGVKKGAQDD